MILDKNNIDTAFEESRSINSRGDVKQQQIVRFWCNGVYIISVLRRRYVRMTPEDVNRMLLTSTRKRYARYTSIYTNIFDYP